MKKRRRNVIIIVIVVVVLALLISPFIRRHPKITAASFITTTVKTGTVTNEVTATGTINPLVSVDVGTQVSGIISKIYVDYNDIVKKSELIALIDTTTLHASVVDTRAALLKARAQLAQQEKEYVRYQDLLAQKAIAQSDYDTQYAGYLSAKSDLEAAEADLNKAQTNLYYAKITAPIDGVVISRNVNIGQTVAASFATPTLFTIANDLKKMQLLAYVDEADIGQVRKGQPAMFNVDAYPDETFRGIVDQIRLQPNTTGNVVTYTVVIDAPNPDLKLLPGMNADVSIVVRKDTNVLTVPMAAFEFSPYSDTAVTTNTIDTVWTLRGNIPVPVKVNKGIDDGTISEISGKGVTDTLRVIIGRRVVVTRQYRSIFPSPHNRPHPPRI